MLSPHEMFNSTFSCGWMLAQGDPSKAVELSPVQQFLQSPFLLMGGLLALFYFIVMVPERRRRNEEAQKLAAIKKNDRIVTIGGIHGVVSAIVDADTLMIRLDESGNAKMKIDRKAVARILAETGESTESKEAR